MSALFVVQVMNKALYLKRGVRGKTEGEREREREEIEKRKEWKRWTRRDEAKRKN